MRRLLLICTIISMVSACDSEPAAPSRGAAPAAPEPAPEEPAEEPSREPLHLGVPPRAIARARQEAAGLYRMPVQLRRQTLERRRLLPSPTYADLREDADTHAHERASFEGRVAFVRSAGPRLWILPLQTRQVSAERWVDPIYVLSSIPPQLPFDGGAIARIDGWVVGDRTIGENTLPLIVAYYVERLDSEDGDAEAAQ